MAEITKKKIGEDTYVLMWVNEKDVKEDYIDSHDFLYATIKDVTTRHG
jgi:hypothetical protein